LKVLGFVPIYRTVGGHFEHTRDTTIRCRWPGTAEEWLDGLKANGMYARWTPEVDRDEPSDGPSQQTYRGARVFRVYPERRPTGARFSPDGSMLMAVWEGRL
jgi:hypothetical protein